VAWCAVEDEDRVGRGIVFRVRKQGKGIEERERKGKET